MHVEPRLGSIGRKVVAAVHVGPTVGSVGRRVEAIVRVEQGI